MNRRAKKPSHQKPGTACARLLVFLCGLLPLAQCHETPRKPVLPAFYFWKTALRISPGENHLLGSLGCNTLFVKVLDIGKNPATGKAEPLAHLETGATDFLAGRQIVPCVFLTNEVFRDLPAAEIDSLARRVARAVGTLQSRLPPTDPPEIQFDCDWTGTTRRAYFQFLKTVRQHLPTSTRLSATVRLHQYKFPEQTGVPPADRGMLMLYNTGDIESPATENSILDVADLRKYLRGAPARYPLPLDLALPFFSWAVVFREGAFWRILPGCDAADLSGTGKFKQLAINRFEALEGVFLDGHYLRPGDLVRLEAVSPPLLSEAAGLARSVILAEDARAAFFHLDSALVRQFPVAQLRAVCDSLDVGRK